MENMLMGMELEDGTKLVAQITSKVSSSRYKGSCGGCYYEEAWTCPSTTCCGEDRDGQDIVWVEVQ